MTKREYEKPYLAVESFQLDAAIAGSCGAEHGTIDLGLSVNNCTLEDTSGDFLPGASLFGEACKADIVSGDSCYHAMSSTGNYLAS